jgi:hypothetical protein
MVGLIALLIPVVVVLLIVVAVVFIVVALTRSAQRPPQPFSTGGHGSMGRPHEPMNPQYAANTIYTNLKSRGGLQPGRAYSTSYFNSYMPYQMVGFADDWLWWQLVFSELNGLMMADGMGFPAYPYEYGGQPSIFFGDPNAGYDPMFYGDPNMDMGMPMDFDPNGFMSPDSYPTQDFAPDSGNWSGGDMLDTPDIDLGASAAMDALGGDSSGGMDMSDFGGGDFGGSDFSDS